MKLSIITPSYNQGRFIADTIESVLSQEIHDLEYWVIDGGSTDETLQVLRRFEGRIHWVSEPDAGQTDAVNKGIRRSAGEIIGWLNSDDIYYPGALATVADFFLRHPEAEIIYGDADHIDEQGQVLSAYPTEDWNYERLLETCFVCQPAVFFRRSLVEKLGLLNTSLNYCMDYEYWLRAGRIAPMVHVPIRLAGSRLYPDTKTLGSRRKVHQEILTMVCAFHSGFPLRWASNLGHVIAEEKGLRRDTAFQELRFCTRVWLTIVTEKLRHGFSLDREDWKLMKQWLAHVIRCRRQGGNG
ncbi:MAG: glycosyltransferase [Veillonellaceae bacterium]|nr:glycosyltransferase [Veillonellaceae bacterium]